MKKYVLDKDGNVLIVVSINGVIPESYTDITKDAIIDSDATDLKSGYLEAELVPEIEGVDEVLEHWTDGESVFHDANDIPTLIDEETDEAYLDPSFIHVPAADAIIHVPKYHKVRKALSADQDLRQIKMNKLSELRKPLLEEADIEINKLEDSSGDSSSWRDYRQALRDVTEVHKKSNKKWKVSVDSLDIDAFIWPEKP